MLFSTDRYVRVQNMFWLMLDLLDHTDSFLHFFLSCFDSHTRILITICVLEFRKMHTKANINLYENVNNR